MNDIKILALSKAMFDDLLKKKGIDSYNVEQQNKLLFISINNTVYVGPPDYPSLKDAKNVIVLHFDDVEKDIDVNAIYGSGRNFTARAMTRNQAEELYSFIKKNIEGKEAVLIHCTAGVSRSGAVASFIHDFVSGNWEEFKRSNPSIVPNAHVYRLLHDEWYLDLEYPTQTIKNKEFGDITFVKNPEIDLGGREGDDALLERWRNRIKNKNNGK